MRIANQKKNKTECARAAVAFSFIVALCQMNGIFECIAEHEHYEVKQNALFRFHHIS